MSLVHLGYDKANHRDYVYSVDENGDKQLEFDELYHATYDAPLPEDSPRYLAYYELPDGSKTFVKGDFIEEKANSDIVQLSREKGFPAYDVPKENVFEYTGVLDINGYPIYEWDYVRIDELGWTGFDIAACYDYDPLESDFYFEVTKVNKEADNKKRLDWIEERKKEYNNDFEKFAEFVYNTYVEA